MSHSQSQNNLRSLQKNVAAEKKDLKGKNNVCVTRMHCVYLLRCAEDMSIILAEPSNTSETSQRTGELVTMQCPKVGPSQRELPPRANTLLKHETKHKKGE